MTKLVYFAWVRERIGRDEEEIDLPGHVRTAGDLLKHLKTLGEEYQIALEHENVIRVAVNHEHVEHQESIAGAREIALFPPMTGG
ncbi:MAG TPA: molybdopterin converting factor subunit 1 [Mycoplana sp.]|uniref:molybdopterin converting factor subunit 1 n=1 Tax=Mycoplana sp. BE70 TaxID=2817775 RepID=UPI002854BA05|nr:molybdopterin converting factor subunit 1 [Mycoplana sp. BE70]MDR6757400.1 molybdopterin synthase sulfur carrier subunit [Mycoplana sp. BE70]HUH49783.1 molybdopterin converting factor subunit 1 [Mycoplana sp.]